MIKKIISILIVVIILGLATWAGIFYYQNLRGVGPAISNPPADVAEVLATDSSGFTMPSGFTMKVFAKDLPRARVMIFDADGNLWLSQTGEGKISKLIIQNGQLVSQSTVFSGLKNPHGLAFDPDNSNILYVAEETKISKIDLASADKILEKIIDLPVGGRHFTRTLGFGPDGRLYVSIGSTCNVCNETDRYAAIYSLNKDGSDFKEVAKGLRNSVFFTWDQNGQMWATEMGRDLLGDNTPPDEINIINTTSADVSNYGWPICYGQNIHDTEFDKNTYIRNPCEMPFEIPSHIDLQAHSAPLGLAFVPGHAGWPALYQNNLIVAFHGSWNRTVPTGYKLVRITLDDNGNFVSQEDFITGWLRSDGALGRPVDVLFNQSGALYISDDKAGVIYQVERVK